MVFFKGSGVASCCKSLYSLLCPLHPTHLLTEDLSLSPALGAQLQVVTTESCQRMLTLIVADWKGLESTVVEDKGHRGCQGQLHSGREAQRDVQEIWGQLPGSYRYGHRHHMTYLIHLWQ